VTITSWVIFGTPCSNERSYVFAKFFFIFHFSPETGEKTKTQMDLLLTLDAPLSTDAHRS